MTPRMNPTKRIVLAACVLFTTTLALFLPSASFPLVNLDDPVFVTYNPIVVDGFSWHSIPHAFTGLHGDRCMYTPLLWLSFLADTLLFRASPSSPAGFHLSNILLHAANAVLLFFVLRLCTRRTLPALLAAAFWALHPLRVESVAWVTERKDTLSTLFALASILLYLKAFSPRGGTSSSHDWSPGVQPPPSTRHSSPVTRHCNKGCQCLALAAFVAGLLSKPMLVTLPFLFLLFDFWPLRRFSYRDALRAFPRLAFEKWPFFLLSAIAAVVTRHLQDVAVSGIPLLLRLGWLPSNYCFYLSKSIWPSALVPLAEGYPVTPLFVFFSAVILVSAVFVALALLRRCPGLAVGFAAFFGLLFPVSGIVVIGAHRVADRYAYLPAIGLSIALAAVLALHPRFRPAFLALALAFLAALAAVTHRILPVWSSSDALYDRIAIFYPNHFNVLATRFRETFFKKGDIPLANHIADAMLARRPSNAIAVWSKLLALAAENSSQDALDFYASHNPSEAIPDIQFHLHVALAALAADVGLPDQALDHLEQAIRDEPHGPDVLPQYHLTASAVCLLAGLDDEALGHARLVPQLLPSPPPSALSPEHRLKPLAALWGLGLYRQTLPALLRLAADAPSNPGILNNLAWLLATTPGSPASPSDALSIARQAHSLVPSSPVILDTLSVALAFDQRFDEAIAIAESLAESLRQTASPASREFLDHLLIRIDLYRRHLPYTEDAAPRLFLDS